MKKYILNFLLAISVPSGALAWDDQPWFGDAVEFEVLPSVRADHYSRVDQGGKSQDLDSTDLTADVNLAFTWDQDWWGRLGISAAKSQLDPHYFNHASMSVGKIWWNDVMGDCLSLATTFNGVWASNKSLRSLSSYEQGHFNGELVLSVGQETSRGPTWCRRWWAAAAVAVAEEGSAWARGKLAYEWNYCNYIQWGPRIVYQEGFGTRDLDLNFPGYRDVCYRFLEAGGQVRYQIDFFGDFLLSFFYRPYAFNTTQGTYSGTLSFLYPFSL